MPEVKDLGLANNEIVSVVRTTGSGLPGQTDTYTITLRSGATYTFNVTNGNIGGGLHFVQTGASTFSNLAIALENAGLAFSSVIKIWATYVDAYNDRILADVVFTGPDETDAEMTPRGQVYDTSNLAFVGADEYLNGKTDAEYWIVYMAPETNPTAYVPVSRSIAGINLESDIPTNTLFDRMNIKGRYATLTALQTADPSHLYCWLVEENNHWYYWNGSAWTDGGEYATTKNNVMHDDIRLEDENGNNLFPDVSGLPYYPVPRTTNKIYFSISGYVITVTIPSQIFYEYKGVARFYNFASDARTFVVPDWYALIWDYDDHAFYVKNFGTGSEEMIGYAHQYCILFLNDHGNIKGGLWETLVEENERLSNPMSTALVAPRTEYDNELTITDGSDHSLIVHLPTTVKQIDYVRNGVFYTLNYTNADITVPNFSGLILNLRLGTLSVIDMRSSGSKPLENYNDLYCVLLYNDNGYPKGEWAKYREYKTLANLVTKEKNARLSNPVLPATVAPRVGYDNELTITKGSSNSLIVHLPSSVKQIDYVSNGVFNTLNYTETDITIPNFSGLIINFRLGRLIVIDMYSQGDKPLQDYNDLYCVLVYNDNGYPKGEWAKYYQYNKFNEQISALGHVKQTTKIMSRQGEGYGYPDNSIEAVTLALRDGYDNVRISVAHTSDNVIYCTHSYEMQNNSTNHCLTLNGETYPDNVDINSSTSTFIDTLLYKGYAIPKLEDMMEVVARNAKQVTFELKDSWDNTTLQQLINISKYYSVEVVFSMSIDSTPTLLTNLDDNLNIALIFHYTDALAETLYNSYKNKSKSIRFDCYYGDTVSFNSVITYIHPNCKLKFGGSSITSTELKEYLTYLDVVEYNLKVSEIGEL